MGAKQVSGAVPQGGPEDSGLVSTRGGKPQRAPTRAPCRQRLPACGLVVLGIVLMLRSTSPAAGKYCEGVGVAEGASKIEVLRQCGEPTFVEERTIYTTVYVYPDGHRVAPHTPVLREPTAPPPLSHRRRAQFQRPVPARREPVPPHAVVSVVPVVIAELLEEWTYNFGPHRLMYRFHFVDGVLRTITTLHYGY